MPPDHAPAGSIAQIWRYPVKSMAGEQLPQAELTPDGMAHDRLFAFESASAPPGMLRVSGAERRELLRYAARFDPATSDVRVRTPAGDDRLVTDPALLGTGFTLTQSSTPQTDVRPLALLSLQTVQQLSEELGETLDPRRFRANLLLNVPEPFAEDHWTGCRVRFGGATLLIRERIPRCRFVTYDPAAPHLSEPLFPLMKLLDRRHEHRIGVYASVLLPGCISAEDKVILTEYSQKVTSASLAML